MSTLAEIIAITGDLQRGEMNSVAVGQLQRMLNALGYQLQVDEDFGPITEIAVKAFQSQFVLKVDGIVGPNTARALDAAIAAPVPVPDPDALVYVDFMMGLGDEATSNGMNVLLAAIKARSTRFVVRKAAESWNDRNTVASRILHRPRSSRNTLIGNSLGANAIPMVTAQCPMHTFELTVGYDPSWAWSNIKLTQNIKKMVHYRGTNFFSLLGKMEYIPAFSGQVIRIETNLLHSTIDDSLELHAATLKHYDKLLAA